MAVVGEAKKRQVVMGYRAVRSGIVGCVLVAMFATVAASAQDAPKDLLPNAPGKNVVVSKCTQCHDESRFAVLRKSGEDWDQIITQMTSNGLTLTEEEYGITLDYLTKNLGLTAVPAAKININKAPAEDLQKTLLVTDQEAAAIVKYRTDHGAFKDWHEVASVAGVDPKKIEAKKDVLTF